jgi:hypothetical protein
LRNDDFFLFLNQLHIVVLNKSNDIIEIGILKMARRIYILSKIPAGAIEKTDHNKGRMSIICRSKNKDNQLMMINFTYINLLMHKM